MAEHNLNRRICEGTMTTRSIGRSEFSDLLWSGYGLIIRGLWWLRWPFLVLGVAAIIFVAVTLVTKIIRLF